MKKIYTEARCRIIWGESAEEVRDFLRESNVPEAQAIGLMATFLEERSVAVRDHARRKMIQMIITMLISVIVLYLTASNLDELYSVPTRRLTVFTMAIAGVAFLWSISRALDTLLDWIHPARFKGDAGVNAS